MAVIRNPLQLAGRRSSIYPPELAAGFDKRRRRALGDAGGLAQFGAATFPAGEPSGHQLVRKSGEPCE